VILEVQSPVVFPRKVRVPFLALWCFSPRPPSCIATPVSGLATRRFIPGLLPTCTACASRCYGFTCVPRELKAAGMDWTEVLAVEAENRRARLAAELLANSAFANTAQRVEAFVRQGGGCRAACFNSRWRLGGGPAEQTT
jgi:hypothetical protein